MNKHEWQLATRAQKDCWLDGCVRIKRLPRGRYRDLLWAWYRGISYERVERKHVIQDYPQRTAILPNGSSVGRYIHNFPIYGEIRKALIQAGFDPQVAYQVLKWIGPGPHLLPAGMVGFGGCFAVPLDSHSCLPGGQVVRARAIDANSDEQVERANRWLELAYRSHDWFPSDATEWAVMEAIELVEQAWTCYFDHEFAMVRRLTVGGQDG